MNKVVERIIAEHKKDFLMSHDLYNKEYATYQINCKGYDVEDTENNKLINFHFNSKNVINLGDVVSVKLSDGNVHNIRVAEWYYDIIDENIEDNYPEGEYEECFPDEYRRYRIEPIELTDEEYELLKRELGVSIPETPAKPKESKVANIFYVIAAIIFIIGFFTFFGGLEYVIDVSPTFLIIPFIIFIQGMLFIGFGKIIHLLTDISNK